MSETVVATNGAALPLASLPQTFAYVGDNLSTITVVYQGVTYVQTLTYSGDNLATSSGWVAQ